MIYLQLDDRRLARCTRRSSPASLNCNLRRRVLSAGAPSWPHRVEQSGVSRRQPGDARTALCPAQVKVLRVVGRAWKVLAGRGGVEALARAVLVELVDDVMPIASSMRHETRLAF
ncbi:hypothetical protein AB0958_20175 [Streptomyces sp. NPDC006655]|uniref:hypothetical protein n=1 Tax=Streptomyces sp. NPDC006655 TaxID=3156898 RepID=UPI003454556F